MNLPNLVTVIRIVLIPVFIILLVYGPVVWALVAFSLAGVTDALDGFTALDVAATRACLEMLRDEHTQLQAA